MTTRSKYNKSEIMTEAWENFNKGFFSTFAEALKMSWLYAKREIAEKEQEAELEAQINAQDGSSYLKDESVKYIFDRLDVHDVEFSHILETVKNNSKGYKKDIAEKGLKYNTLSTKQAWCIAYEYKNVA